MRMILSMGGKYIDHNCRNGTEILEHQMLWATALYW